jgi:hypothetical protein
MIVEKATALSRAEGNRYDGGADLRPDGLHGILAPVRVSGEGRKRTLENCWACTRS